MILGVKEIIGVPQSLEHKGKLYAHRTQVSSLEDAKIYAEPYKRDNDIIIAKCKLSKTGFSPYGITEYHIFMRKRI